MSSMFQDASAFNQDLNSWNVSNVINIERMFMNATAFDGNISAWSPGSATNMAQMFR